MHYSGDFLQRRYEESGLGQQLHRFLVAEKVQRSGAAAATASFVDGTSAGESAIGGMGMGMSMGMGMGMGMGMQLAALDFDHDSKKSAMMHAAALDLLAFLALSFPRVTPEQR